MLSNCINYVNNFEFEFSMDKILDKFVLFFEIEIENDSSNYTKLILTGQFSGVILKNRFSISKTDPVANLM